MIVLLDIEKKTISIYGKKGMVEIPFNKAGSMYDHIDSENVLYITNAVEATASEILELIKKMGVTVDDDIQETGIKYLHAAGEKPIYIDEDLQFKGKFDCKMIDSNLSHLIENSYLLQNLIKNKKIEIIGERKKASLHRQHLKAQIGYIEQKQQVDDQLDNLILKTKVDDVIRNGTSSDFHDSEEIDILAGGSINRYETEDFREDISFDTLSNLEGLE